MFSDEELIRVIRWMVRRFGPIYTRHHYDIEELESEIVYLLGKLLCHEGHMAWISSTDRPVSCLIYQLVLSLIGARRNVIKRKFPRPLDVSTSIDSLATESSSYDFIGGQTDTGPVWVDLNDEVEHVLAKCSKENRHLLEAYYLRGQSHREIAELLGVSMATVGNKIRTEVKRIRHLLNITP